MKRATRQFYILVCCVLLGLLSALVLLLVMGDKVGQPLQVSLTYLPEGTGGLPQVELTFQGKAVPVLDALEASFEITPAVPGDFTWKDPTLIFSPAAHLESDTIYQVRLRGGLKLNGSGRSAYDPVTLYFRTRPARIAFLRREGQATNLWITGGTPGAGAGAAGGNGNGNNDGVARALTFETDRQVLDFTVSPGGESIIYSLAEPDNLEASLWLVKTNPGPGEKPRRLVSDTGVRATAPSWSPGGDIIAYERRLILGGGAVGQPQLWLIRSDGTSLAPLYGGSQRYGTGLNWAAGGSKAIFWEPARQALGIFDFSDEPAWKPLPGLIPQSFAVSPEGNAIVLARYDYSGPTQRQLLTYLTFQPESNSGGGKWEIASLPFSGEGIYNDYSPGWSPDGKLVAFVREEAGGAAATRASRIWLFEPGSSGKTWPLLSEIPANISLGRFQWSPDGQKLLYERFPSRLKTGSNESEIWEINRDGTANQKVVGEAFEARWVN